MATDAHFLAAISAHPADRLPRLVYADWLDEHDDPRGELIRLEEETRERVAWDDTLWKLKPRRNELRRQVDADWLKAMDYGRHCEPLFRGQPFPTDVRDAWRLIREAHERWTGEPMPDVGGHADKIAEAEKRLGLMLPASVREYVAFAHDWNRVRRQCKRRHFSRAHHLQRVPGQPALSFHRQGYFQNALRLEDLTASPDPPVTVFAPDWTAEGEPDEEQYQLASVQLRHPLSHVVFDHAFSILGAGAGEMSDDFQQVYEVRARLLELFPFRTARGGVEWFEAENVTGTLRTPGRRSAAFLEVRASWPIGGPRLSPWLLAVCRTNGFRSGVFRDIQQLHQNEQRISVGLPPITDDDIPF